MIDLAKYSDRLNQSDFNDVLKRLEYGSFVGEKHKYVFLETPKAACSSLKWILLDIEGKSITLKHKGKESSLAMCVHYRSSQNLKSLPQLDQEKFDNILNDDTYVRFCVVRNPYARLVSAWSHKIRQKEPGYARIWHEIADYAGKSEAECPSFGDFVNWLAETHNLKNCNHHWLPMVNILLPDLIRYTHIIHTENLDEELQQVLKIFGETLEISKYRMNESLPVDWKSCYDENIATVVAKIYKEDFERYGYDLDSWRSLLPKRNEDNLELEVICLRNQLKEYEKIALETVRDRNDVIFELWLNKVRQKSV